MNAGLAIVTACGTVLIITTALLLFADRFAQRRLIWFKDEKN